MSEQNPTDDAQSEEDEPTWLYSEDPASEIALGKLNEAVAFYRFAHAVITGKFDQNFSEWTQAEQSKVPNDAKVDHLPNLVPLKEWMFADATVQDLFLFRKALTQLQQALTVELFSNYSKKNVRGQIPADFNLSDARKSLVETLTSWEKLIRGTMAPLPITIEQIEALPAMRDNEEKKARRSDGNWNLPNAPSDESAEVKTSQKEGTNNFRAHNTTVKFVVDGKLHEAATLGTGIAEVFGKDKSTKDIGALFESWHTDYSGDGKNEPKKILARDGRKIYWTIVGEEK